MKSVWRRHRQLVDNECNGLQAIRSFYYSLHADYFMNPMDKFGASGFVSGTEWHKNYDIDNLSFFEIISRLAKFC